MMKHLILPKNKKLMGINVDLFQWFIIFFCNNACGSGFKIENISNKEKVEELHKPIIGKFNKRKLPSPLIDNIWGADLGDMQLIKKFNKGFY